MVFSGDRLGLYEGTQFILGDVRAGSPRGTQVVGVYKGTQFVFVHTVYLDCPPKATQVMFFSVRVHCVCWQLRTLPVLAHNMVRATLSSRLPKLKEHAWSGVGWRRAARWTAAAIKQRELRVGIWCGLQQDGRRGESCERMTRAKNNKNVYGGNGEGGGY